MSRLSYNSVEIRPAGGPGPGEIFSPRRGCPEPVLNPPKDPSLLGTGDVGSAGIHGQDTRKPGRPSKSLRLAVNRA